MAKKTKIEIDVKADDKGSVKKVGVESKKAAKGMGELGTASNNARRNLGGAAEMSNRGTKNFSKMSQGVGGLVGAYATLAAQVFAVSAAFQFLKSASDVANLIAGQEALGAVTGVAYKTITNSVIAATDGQIAYADAAKAAAIGTAAGLSPTQLDKLGTAAKNVSNALGRDLTDSFNRLVRGVTKAEPELLDELGIILRLDDASQNYADKLGIAKGSLSTFQKSQAVANEVLDQATKKFAAIEEIMDPSAASLNQFLTSFDELMNSVKTGAMDLLRPVFDFLSKNTTALVASLGLLAIPILKSILPAFGEWEDKAVKAFDNQKNALSDLGDDLNNLKGELTMMGQEADEVLKTSNKTSKQAFKEAGSKVKGKEGGGKGVDFLLGTSDTKRAQANAKKVLANAQAQMKQHGKIMTGELQGFSQKQLNILQRNYDARVRLIKKVEVQSKFSYKAMGLHVKTWAVKTKMIMTGVQQFATKWGGKMAGVMNKAFALAGWVGMIMMVIQALKELWNWMFPISDETQKMRDKIEEFTSSSETLNKELAKMDEVQPLLNMKEQVEQLGNAVNSADIANRIAEFNKLDEGEKGYEAAQKGLLGTLDALSDLHPEFEAYYKIVEDGGKIEGENAEALNVLSEAMREQGIASKNLAETTKTLKDEMTKLAGTGIVVDPTATVRSVLDKQVKEYELSIAGLRNMSKAAIQNISDAKEQQAILQEQWDKNKHKVGSALLGKGAQAMGDALEAQNEKVEKMEANEAKRLEYINQQVAKQEHAKLLLEAMEGASKDLTESFENRLKKEEAAAKMKTLGITFAEKEANLVAGVLTEEAKHMKVLDKQTAARAAAEAAQANWNKKRKNAHKLSKDILTEAEKTHKAAQAALKQANTEVEVSKHNLDLKRKGSKSASEALTTEEAILEVQKKQNSLQNALVAARRMQDKELALFSGSSLEKARKQGEFSLANKKAEVEIAQQAMAAAGEALHSNELVSEEEKENRRQALFAAQEAFLLAQQHLDLEKQTTAQVIARMEAANKDLRGQANRMSLDPKKAFVNEQLYQAELEAKQPMSAEEKNRVKDLAAAQFDLNLEIEQTQSLYDTVNNSMASAFEGMITGAKSAKEAFADMAKAILADLAKMIAKQIALQAIASTSSFFGFKEGGVTPEFAGGGISPLKGKRYTVGGIARGPSHGYNAVLHGNEAVVPLPSGGKIPVEFPQQTAAPMGSQQNNVSVTVNMDGNRSDSETTADSNMGENLGNMVAKAVQEELQYQKRSGGILNPYGAA